MTRVSRRTVIAAVLCMAGAAYAQPPSSAEPPLAATVSPADAALEKKTSAVASQLRCPVCQGESIEDSPAELAREMRSLVRDQLREGKTPDEVEAYFVARYGEWILLEPTMTGLNAVLWVFPVLLVLGGLALVAVLVRKWSRADGRPPAHTGQAGQ